jgi:hypothetical protein
VIPSTFPRKRQPITAALTASVAVLLSGCAIQRPAGPTIMVLPAQGESFAVFQQHDASCRQYASTQTGGRSPGQAAAANEIGGAVAGAGVGAAAGALVGSATGRAGSGAAIGAGSGLLAGTLLGSSSGLRARAAVLNRYNIAYSQCMAANGERVALPAPPPSRVGYRPAAPSVIYVPAQQ